LRTLEVVKYITLMVGFRPYCGDDLEALYAISLATGAAGGDAAHLYGDRRLIGHIYSAPYAVLAPELVLVAEDDQGVGGFVLGALDTENWQRMLERSWWPVLRRQYPSPDLATRDTWSADDRRAFIIHHPEPVPSTVADAYPGHVHLNLLPRLQGRGIGHSLLGAWLESSDSRRATSIHVGINRDNLRAISFWEKVGFQDLSPMTGGQGRTLWRGRHPSVAS
jgi:ribosomal protein S18 acetylase RimI-like enzyme